VTEGVGVGVGVNNPALDAGVETVPHPATRRRLRADTTTKDLYKSSPSPLEIQADDLKAFVQPVSDPTVSAE